MVREYLDSRPDPAAYDFLRHDFGALESSHGGVAATSFQTFPSYPQRFIEVLGSQPAHDGDQAGVEVEPIRAGQPRRSYTSDDLYVRQFLRDRSRHAAGKRQFKAA